VVAQDIPLFKVAAAGGIADVVPAVARLLQHGDGGAVRGAGLDGVVRPRAGADIQSAAAHAGDHRVGVGGQGGARGGGSAAGVAAGVDVLSGAVAGAQD